MAWNQVIRNGLPESKKRSNRVFFCLILPILCILSLCACGKQPDPSQEAEDGTYAVYYKNQGGTRLESRNYQATGSDAETLVRELLGQMRISPDEIALSSVFPENLSMSEYEVEPTFVSLYFDGSYSDLQPGEEILLRAAVVKTLCQIPEISYITFMVNKQPLMDAKGMPVGIMQPDSFIEKMNESLDSMQPVTLILYFTNETGDLLYETERTVIYNSDMSMEKLVINQLIAGPDNDSTYPTLPENLTLLGTSVKDGVCYVNFDSSLVPPWFL